MDIKPSNRTRMPYQRHHRKCATAQAPVIRYYSGLNRCREGGLLLGGSLSSGRLAFCRCLGPSRIGIPKLVPIKTANRQCTSAHQHPHGERRGASAQGRHPCSSYLQSTRISHPSAQYLTIAFPHQNRSIHPVQTTHRIAQACMPRFNMRVSEVCGATRLS